MSTIYEKMTAIANAIRQKTGKSESLTLDEMASDLNDIPDNSVSDISVNGATVTIPAGNYKESINKSVATATQATPSISVDSAGKITATVTQSAGYIEEGIESSTKQLTVQAAQTITPGTSNKTIASGTYLTGTQTIAGDDDLVASNIKKGVNIFGVTGSYTNLNFTIVNGTSAPSNPAANTIWINTSTSITDWEFISTIPTWSMSNGWVYIVYESSTNNRTADFDAIGTNGIWINPIAVYQYVNNAWVKKTAKIYKNNTWVDWDIYLIRGSDLCESITGGWTSHAIEWPGQYNRGDAPKLTKNSDSITLSLTYTEWHAGVYATNNRINLDNVNKISVDGFAYEFDEERVALVVYSELGDDAVENSVAVVAIGTENQTYELNVTGLKGEYFIGIRLLSTNNVVATVTIKEIRME